MGPQPIHNVVKMSLGNWHGLQKLEVRSFILQVWYYNHSTQHNIYQGSRRNFECPSIEQTN